jgi:ubiquitin-like 1-activating enzyme E1 B
LPIPRLTLSALISQTVLTSENAARVFVSAVARILTRDKNAKSGYVLSVSQIRTHCLPILVPEWTITSAHTRLTLSLIYHSGTDTFDKDDALACDFVTAVTTLRSANYNIATQSPFDIKGVAGNIVHAVATTNAIVGGLIVLEAVKLLRAKNEKEKKSDDACLATTCPRRYTFVKQRATNNRLLEPIECDTPNPKCAVCQSARLELVCDTNVFTLGRLLNDALKKKLGMHAPEIEGSTTTLFLQPDGLEDDELATYENNLVTVLADLPGGGVVGGSTLQVSDFSQSFEFELLVTHQSEWNDEADPDLFLLRGDSSGIGKDDEAKNAGKKDTDESGNAPASDDDLEIIEEETSPLSPDLGGGKDDKKRGREEDTQAGDDEGGGKAARRE